MNPDQAVDGVHQRITKALALAYAAAPLTGVPIPSPQVPAFALPPDEADTRVCQAMSLTIPPGVDIFALFAEELQRSAHPPRSWSLPDGPALMAIDPAGFLLIVHDRAGQIELYVVSPRLSSVDRNFYAGLALGGLLGIVGPCCSAVAILAFDDEPLLLWFVPVILLLGGSLLIRRGARRFGLGLLTGGAIAGIVTAGLCTM